MAEEQKLIDNYKEKLTNGIVYSIQGDNISKILDYLSKEIFIIKEEQKNNGIYDGRKSKNKKRSRGNGKKTRREYIKRYMTKELQ